MKAWWGKAATAENNWAFDYLPKLDKLYDMLQVYELMNQGKMNGYLAQGFNPLAAAPNKAKLTAGFSKLKYLVIMDPLVTETSEFWRNAGEANDVDPRKIQTEVFRLPTTCFAEEDGALVNSGRWLQWHWKGAEPGRGQERHRDHVADLHAPAQDVPGRGRQVPRSHRQPVVAVFQPAESDRRGTGQGILGQGARRSGRSQDPTKITRKAGEQLAAFAELRDDGSTASGCWIFAGAWSPAGNLMARRDNNDPTGIGQTLNWAWAWPANRRILYNRASCDVSGKPFDPRRSLISWNGKSWGGADIPDFKADENPEGGMGPFIMNPGAWRASSPARAWPRVRSPSTTSRSRRRWATTRCIPRPRA